MHAPNHAHSQATHARSFPVSLPARRRRTLTQSPPLTQGCLENPHYRKPSWYKHLLPHMGPGKAGTAMEIGIDKVPSTCALAFWRPRPPSLHLIPPVVAPTSTQSAGYWQGDTTETLADTFAETHVFDFEDRAKWIKLKIGTLRAGYKVPPPASALPPAAPRLPMLPCTCRRGVVVAELRGGRGC